MYKAWRPVMRFISVTDLRGDSSDIWRDLHEERQLVVTSNGRPVAILAAVNESNLEESLIALRRARAVEATASLQRDSVASGADALTAADIEAEIAAVRDESAPRS